MELTIHAIKRMRQRGFPYASPEIIMEYGRRERAKGDAVKFFLGKREYDKADQEIKKQYRDMPRERKMVLHVLDKCKKSTVVTSNGNILTLYKNAK